MIGFALLWLAAISGLTFVSFGTDKQRAMHGLRRTPEADLLFLALIGGSPGAYAGRAWFRHKTRKVSFSMKLHLILVAQIGALAGLFLPVA